MGGTQDWISGMSTRRFFLKSLSVGGVGLFVRGTPNQLVAALPGGSLDPLSIPRFQTPLLIPPVMPKAGAIVAQAGKNIDYYEISVEQFSQQILPNGFPQTTVWGYGPVAKDKKKALLLHNAPSLTIEADWNRPVRIKWVNGLLDEQGKYLPHLLPVDATLHWANPPGGVGGRDTRPASNAALDLYEGPVPIVTHVHGAVGVGDESDGYPEAWYLPAARDIPAEYAKVGTWYKFFRQKAVTRFGAAWEPGSAVFQYPNDNRASTLWYHDHTLGLTRLNVYAGPAGFYLVRGGPAGDDAAVDSRTGLPAVLPGPAPKANDTIPSKKTYYEIPIAIQDRSFNADGSLFYPDSREFFDGASDFLPDTDLSPVWNPEFFGNTIMVNGKTWPFQTVEKRRYRMRFLNGCQSRVLILDFAGIPGVQVWQIGNEGGFLAAPVHLTARSNNRLLMGLAERADVIVDFTNVPTGNHILRNAGPDEPFGGLEGLQPAEPETTGQIMQFRVTPAMTADPTTPPQFLRLPAITKLPMETKTRRLALLEKMSMYVPEAPVEALLGTVNGDPSRGVAPCVHRMWMDPVTEDPMVGATELWEMYNTTGDAHPMHIHEVVFEVVNRQEIEVGEFNDHAHGMMTTVKLVPGSQPRPPEPWETGFKDTVLAYPGQVTRVRMQFNNPGQFVWHCHIVEHEDNEMMRPYRIGDMQVGQP